jgi:hypothetical protein
MVNKDNQAPKIGMNRDSSAFEISKEYYTFALNTNIQDEHGSGQVVLQNEPSNVKCTGFKPGYKVVGHKYDARDERVYFFLTNPTTGFSEIGFISTMQEAERLTPNESQVGTEIEVILENPLENTTQTNTCIYNTILSDACSGIGSGCLNFSIYYPIKEANVQISHGKRGTTLWFTDNRNPQRFIDVSNPGQYTERVDPCDDEEQEICLDCEKMRVFPLINKPCLEPKLITGGGNLRAGIYEVLIGGADEENNILTNLYSQTNVIPIFDRNNVVLDQTLLDYQTNFAIGIDVFSFDEKYEFFSLVVLYRNGLDGALSSFKLGPFNSSRTSVTIDTLQGADRIDLRDVISLRPTYEKARGLAQSNGYLYHYGLTQHREVNLQPVINLLGGFAQWASYTAKETLYSEAEGVAKYKSAMRDEVYPYSIRFFNKGGHMTALFPFIARPPFDHELHEIDTEDFPLNTEVTSVLAYNPECSENNRKLRWQFENTAIQTEKCFVPSESFEEQEVVVEQFSNCTVTDEEGEIKAVDTIAESTFVIPVNQDIVSYINTNIATIIASTGTNGEDIRDILSDPAQYEDNCEPFFPDNCEEDTTLVSEEMFAIEAESQVSEVVVREYTEVEASNPNTNCNHIERDVNNTLVVDTTFVSGFMEPGENVFVKLPVPNNTCASAQIPPTLTSPQFANSYHLNHAGQLNGASTLLSSKTSSATRSRIKITLTGTNGDLTININGTNYTFTITGSDLTASAATFVATNAAAILADTNLILTSVANELFLNGPFAGFYETTITPGTGNANATYDNSYFSSNLHSNAVWFQLPMAGQQATLFEMSRVICQLADDNTTNSVRISAYTLCSTTGDLSQYSVIINDITTFNPDMFVGLLANDFGGINGIAYIAVDTELRVRPKDTDVAYTLTTTCGCFSAYQREAEIGFEISYTKLTFGKRQRYKTDCNFKVPVLNSNCEAIPNEKGLFSYVESSELYPCNKELYDSSVLRIRPQDIPTSIQASFEAYYTDGLDADGFYMMKPDTDFRDKPIRHYKYPDNTVSPFMSVASQPSAQSLMAPALIHPIGFHIPGEAIEAFLDIAVNNNLISAKERLELTHYEIFRGDRRIQKTVIAKGLLYDMYKYQETNQSVNQEVYYPNFPLNSLGTDQYHNVPHPYNSQKNRFFTFHSPDTHFEKPSLPRELYVDSYMLGESLNYFDEVRNHPTYILLGNAAYGLATTLAIAEQTFEFLLQSGQLLVLGSTGGVGLPVSGPLALLYVGLLGAASVFRVGEIRLRWIRTIKNLGKPNQFAYYQASIGHYNSLISNQEAAQKLRGLAVTKYMKDGFWIIPNETQPGTAYNVNNLDREYSVALHTGEYDINYPQEYIGKDNVSNNAVSASRRFYTGKGKSGTIKGNVGSPYAAIKQYRPSQYGTIDSITWLSTGFCGELGDNDSCVAAFGGDIFISRMTLKRKIPFFRTNAFGLAPLTPFKYSDYFNINADGAQTGLWNHTHVDYEVNEAFQPIASTLFPSDRSFYRLFDAVPPDSVGGIYIKPPLKFFLFSYGIPSFLVESEINCNFRYAKRERHEDFYPNVQDVIEWTQEQNVSIREPNTFFYNRVYSQTQAFTGQKMLPQTYSRQVFDNLNNLDNFVCYSRQDVSESGVVHPWRTYRALDSHNFSLSMGRLTAMKGIESLQLAVLFENGFEVFGAIDNLADRLTPETKNLGTGGIFAGRPVSFNKTDTGHQGSQNNVILSCEAGHFWADAKRGKVFMLAPNGQGIQEISKNRQGLNLGVEKWFKDQLPFKILRSFPNLDIDNNYNFIGITMGWDDRTKRVFLTKKDYIPKRNDIRYLEGIGFYIRVNNVNQPVNLEDTRYFTDASWTIAYNPYTDGWISYYSFKPNYYASYNNYFQTGINTTVNPNRFGLWSHLPFIGSWQVFYGERFPFIVEYPIQTKGVNSQLQYVDYWLETRKYYNKYNFTDAVGIGFNKAMIYNTYQNTGMLELVYQNYNNPFQLVQYPNYLANSAEVLQTEIAGKWSINHMFNAIRRENQGLPIFLNDVNNIHKTLDNRLIQQNTTVKDYLRGDYFLVRLINDKESRYKYLLRYTTDSRNFYQQ